MYTGTYFDGKTSKGYSAFIEFLTDGIHISYTDDELNKSMVIWDVDGIHKGHYSNDQRITLKYGEVPLQYLEVSGQDFFKGFIAAYPHKRFNESSLEFLRTKGFKGVMVIGIGFLLLAGLSYFFVLPPLAEFLASKMPIGMEIQLGDKMYDQVMQSYNINQRLTKEANEYWRAMHVSSPYIVNITVVNNSEPNAFALPGGQIIVYDGIIREMNDYDELAGLLAHEYSHVRLHHSTRMMSRNLAGYLFISLLLKDASGTLAVLVTNANSLKELSYSRGLEHQADEGGYDMLQSVHINPDGMLKLFKTLNSYQSKIGLSVPKFISTHPLTEERISYISDRLKKDKTSYSGEQKALKKIWQEMKSDE